MHKIEVVPAAVDASVRRVQPTRTVPTQTVPPRVATGADAASHPVAAHPAVAGEGSGLALLLRIEALARSTRSIADLRHVLANETRKINRARQIFVVEVPRRGAPEVTAVTGVASPDARSSLVLGVTGVLRRVGRERGLSLTTDFTLPAYCEPGSDLTVSYPFREILWVPFLDRQDRVFAGLVLAREQPWISDDFTITQRLAATFAHAWRELATAEAFNPGPRFSRWKLVAAACAASALAIPVPVTALAPAEIVAADALVVAAPIDGVIDHVVVDPSGKVAPGDILVRLADTVLRNRVEVARREVAVAEAKAKQAGLMAFGDPRGRHELGIAQAELELKKADLGLANEQLERTVIRSTRAGIAIYADRRQLVGKPVATGERIMEIANPSAVEVRADLALPDAIALKHEAHVKLFLDVDPLRPLRAQVTRSDYLARPSDSDVLSFRTFARLETSQGAPPRIGLRGTAQVWGDAAPLLVVLLRRPISAARQWLGL